MSTAKRHKKKHWWWRSRNERQNQYFELGPSCVSSWTRIDCTLFSQYVRIFAMPRPFSIRHSVFGLVFVAPSQLYSTVYLSAFSKRGPIARSTRKWTRRHTHISRTVLLPHARTPNSSMIEARGNDFHSCRRMWRWARCRTRRVDSVFAILFYFLCAFVAEAIIRRPVFMGKHPFVVVTDGMCQRRVAHISIKPKGQSSVDFLLSCLLILLRSVILIFFPRHCFALLCYFTVCQAFVCLKHARVCVCDCDMCSRTDRPKR